jgi:hypothetical protein
MTITKAALESFILSSREDASFMAEHHRGKWIVNWRQIAITLIMPEKGDKKAQSGEIAR